MAGDAQDAARAAAGSTRSTAREVRRTARTTTADARDAARRTAGDAREAARGATGDAREAANDVAGAARRAGARLPVPVRRDPPARRLARRAESLLRRDAGGPPRAAIAAGLGAAAALGGAAAAWRWDARRISRAVAADPAAAALAEPVPARRRRIVARDGIELNVAVAGPEDDDAPVVVLVHGWTCAMRFWRQQARDLARDHRVVAYDLRGHGDSDAPGADDFTTDSLADDLQAVLDATLPRGRRAVLVGHSLGAMSIVAWAGRHPDQVARRACAAGLLNTGLGDLVSESLVVPLPKAGRGAQDRLGALFLSAPGPLPKLGGITHHAIRHVALSPQATAAQVAFCEDLVVGTNPRVRAGHGRMLSTLDLRESAHALTVPTLVLAGDRDRLTPRVHAERLAEALPDPVDHVTVPGSGHMSPVEQPDAVNAAIRRLAEHAAAAPAAEAVREATGVAAGTAADDADGGAG